MQRLGVIRDVDFIPKPNELCLILTDQLPPRDRTTAAMALAFDGQRLLMTRLRDAYRDWDIPGGHIGPGETPEDAMRREVYEETAARLGAARLFACLKIRLLGPEPDGYAHPYPDSYIVFFLAQVLELDPFVENEEARDRGLLPPEQVCTTRWGQQNPALFEAAFSSRPRNDA